MEQVHLAPTQTDEIIGQQRVVEPFETIEDGRINDEAKLFEHTTNAAKLLIENIAGVGEKMSDHMPRKVIAAGAAGILALGGTGAAMAAKSGTKASMAYQKSMYECKHKAFIREGSKARKGPGIVVSTKRDSENRNVFSYKLTSKGIRFKKAMAGVSGSFDPIVIKVNKKNSKYGVIVDKMNSYDKGHITQVSFCAGK